jgi:MoaA/NifB/PqqE/SkfB family radical SAM enzyme
MRDPGPLPRALYIEPTNRCNSLCTECPRTFGINTESPRDLSFAEFDMLIEQVPDLQRVVLHGLGEPLMNPHAPAMVAKLRARRVDVTFNSNAILLNRRRGEALIAADLPELRVSLDGGSRQTYTLMRGVDKLAQVQANLAAFARLKAREELAIFGQTRRREEEILLQCEERCGALGLRFTASGAVDPRASVARHGTDRAWQACHRPYSLTYITANGNVLSCCFVPFTSTRYQETLLGNIFEQPLATIWQGARYTAFRTRFESDEPPQWCAGCGSKWSI